MNKVVTGKGFLLSVVMITLVAGCRDAATPKKEKTFPQKDTTITTSNSFSELFMDSARVEQFISSVKTDDTLNSNLRSFYNSRNYQYAWFNNQGLNEQAVSFWNLYTSYIGLSKDSILYNKDLADRITRFTEEDSLPIDQSSIAQTDLDLTRQFFLYTRAAYRGRLDPTDLQWFIPRKKVDALALLDSLVDNKGTDLERWEPLNPLYQSLKKKLVLYNTVSDNGGWQPVLIEKNKTYKQGDSSAVITALKQRLAATEDLAQGDTSATFTPELTDAVKRMQKSFGFKETGIVNKALTDALNVPVKQRIEQMLVNLERMRWLPENTTPDKIVVNIPEFIIHVFEQNKIVFDMPIVVGSEANSTVIFSDQLKYVVFSPYWNVPRSIVRKEIYPAMQRNKNYIASHNMEVTGHSGGLPVVRQKPGGSNSLGRVKFLFPNNYNIYFHDTPAKSLFSREKRAFSHGCIRLADATKMATYLLRDQPEWTPAKINEAMRLSKEKWVTLKKSIPVFITYFTSWVDDNGILNFRDDIYGHDKEMAKHLFMQPAAVNGQ
ncbi:MAG: L,D-transpeptidase family protein [Chitinophagaceae bacterium]